MGKNSPAKIEANNRYKEKTYDQFTFQLNVERDADIIEAIQEAKDNGLSYREWIRELFDIAN